MKLGKLIVPGETYSPATILSRTFSITLGESLLYLPSTARSFLWVLPSVEAEKRRPFKRQQLHRSPPRLAGSICSSYILHGIVWSRRGYTPTAPREGLRISPSALVAGPKRIATSAFAFAAARSPGCTPLEGSATVARRLIQIKTK